APVPSATNSGNGIGSGVDGPVGGRRPDADRACRPDAACAGRPDVECRVALGPPAAVVRRTPPVGEPAPWTSPVVPDNGPAGSQRRRAVARAPVGIAVAAAGATAATVAAGWVADGWVADGAGPAGDVEAAGGVPVDTGGNTSTQPGRMKLGSMNRV